MMATTTNTARRVLEAAIAWAKGGEGRGETLSEAVADLLAERDNDGPVTRGHSPLKLRHRLRRQLRAHGVPADDGTVAACVSVLSADLLVADLDRETLARLVHAVEATEVVRPSPRLRALLDQAYEDGVPQPNEDECPCPSCAELKATRDSVLVTPVRHGFHPFAVLVGGGTDADDAARQAGGTGRPS